jgi:flagellin
MPDPNPERRNIMAISLTAGMRSNLINLQNTAKLMEQTAVRLNTGKKVNTALDDPISYFTAKNHMSRVSDLGTLKNGMSEGIQTLTAANAGIESIIDLIEAAKAKAESAKSAEAAGTGNVTSTITLSSVTVGDEIIIDGYTFTAVTGSLTASMDFSVGADDTLQAVNLAQAIASADDATGFSVDVSGINGATISVEDTETPADIVAATITFSDTNAFTETLISASTDRDELVAQYATLMSQIDQLQADSTYKGTNLLDVSNSLTVEFEGTNEIVVAGFDGDVSGLLLNNTAGNGTGWGTDTLIDADIALMDAAIDTLESEASSLASSLSIVTTRQSFTENMMNTLTTGADNLTLADMNEEGANMLMLQTQQALGTNSLSLAAQTAQGVLRLF